MTVSNTQRNPSPAKVRVSARLHCAYRPAMTRIALALAALLTIAASPDKVTHKVELAGVTYRVTVEGSAVTIADKSVWTKRSPERGDNLRAAAKQATGCAVRDTYWEGAKLRGSLDCPQSSPTP